MDKYEFNGNCAFAVSFGKMDVSDCPFEMKVDGKNYKFSNKMVMRMCKWFPGILKKAEKNWDNAVS